MSLVSKTVSNNQKNIDKKTDRELLIMVLKKCDEMSIQIKELENAKIKKTTQKNKEIEYVRSEDNFESICIFPPEDSSDNDMYRVAIISNKKDEAANVIQITKEYMLKLYKQVSTLRIGTKLKISEYQSDNIMTAINTDDGWELCETD